MMSIDVFHIPMLTINIKKYSLLLALFVVVEYIQRNKAHGLCVENQAVPLRWLWYTLALYVIIFFGNFNKVEFIYFQF